MYNRLWALRRSESLAERHITHVLSMVAVDPNTLKNFKDEPWSKYGRGIEHLVIDIDDDEDANLLIELPRAVRFINEGLRSHKSSAVPKKSHSEIANNEEDETSSGGGVSLEEGVGSLSLGSKKDGGSVFVHCAAGKSRSVSAVVAYLLWRFPERFDPSVSAPSENQELSEPETRSSPRPRRETALRAVSAAVAWIQSTRPMAEPNDGFMKQLQLWWEMNCPVDRDIETHHLYQRWAYEREVQEHLAVGQAPTRLRFEDEERNKDNLANQSGLNLRCKMCRRALATSPFIIDHQKSDKTTAQCQHYFIEPLSWMRGELEKGTLNGRLLCPNARCGAGVGRYDWKGFKCSCGGWVTPAFSLQKGRVDDIVINASPSNGVNGRDARQQQQSLGIRMPPGARGVNL